MIEIGDQAGGKTIGGFHALDEVFGSVVLVQDLVPVVTGNQDRVVAAVEDTENGSLQVVHLEHIGFFLPKSGMNPDKAWLALRTAFRHGNELLTAALKPGPFPLPSTITEILEPVPKAPAVRKFMKETREMMEEIVPLFEKVGAKVSAISRAPVIAKVRTGVELMPSNVFTELCEAYIANYLFVYPYWRDVVATAIGCHCDDLFHVSVTRRLFTPLFVEKASVKIIHMEVENELREITETVLFFLPFKGLHLTMGGSNTITPMTHDSEDIKLTMTMTQEDIKNSLIADEATKKLAETNAAKHPKWKEYSDNAKAVDAFYNVGTRYAQQVCEKYIKLACQTPLLMGLIQGQIRLNMWPWSANSAPRKHTESQDPRVYLTWLQEHYEKRMRGALDSIDKASDDVVMGAFEYVDVSVNFDGAFGSVTAPTVSNNTGIRLRFVHGSSSVVKAIRKITGRVASVPKGSTRHQSMPVVGMWSAYNSYEFTELGNMEIDANPNNNKKQYLTKLDPQKLGGFKYEVKFINGVPPNSFIYIMYNLRHTLLTTVGAFLGLGCPHGIDATNIALSFGNGPLVESMKAIVGKAPQGLFGRVDLRKETSGNNFALTSGVSNARGKGFFIKKKAPGVAGTRAFESLEWITNPATADALSGLVAKKLGPALKLYSMKDMILDLERDTGKMIWYLRPHFISPLGMSIKTAQILVNKSEYTNAPVAFNAVYNITPAGGNIWCTIHLEGNKWERHTAYQLSIDKNRVHYSPETIEGWKTSKRSALGSCEAPDDIVTALLTDLEDDEPVTSAFINEFLLSRDTYEIVVAKLKAVNRFQKTDEFMFADVAPNRADEVNVPVENPLKRPAEEYPMAGIIKSKRHRNQD